MIPRQFKNDFFRHFSNIVFVQRQQMLIVKTWQKTRYTEYSADQEDSDSEEDAKEARKASNDAPSGGEETGAKKEGVEAATVKKTGHLWIKSLKIFDIENREKVDILLEHVDGEHDRFRLYDGSFV